MFCNSLVVTDLDGTLLDAQGNLSPKNRNTLLELGKRGVVRVVASGRSPFSFERVVGKDFPIDYLIFSSGAGILNWYTRQLLRGQEIEPYRAQQAVETLVGEDVDFMVHGAIPLNHRFHYHDTGNGNPDFLHRISLYSEHCLPWVVGNTLNEPTSQFVVVLSSELERFQRLSSRMEGLKVVRTTSPLDGRSIWMELFHQSVSKGNATHWLCENLQIASRAVVAVGNDYNDVDMLEAFEQSFIVDNAPSELKARYRVVEHHDRDGFSEAISLSGLLGNPELS